MSSWNNLFKLMLYSLHSYFSMHNWLIYNVSCIFFLDLNCFFALIQYEHVSKKSDIFQLYQYSACSHAVRDKYHLGLTKPSESGSWQITIFGLLHIILISFTSTQLVLKLCNWAKLPAGYCAPCKTAASQGLGRKDHIIIGVNIKHSSTLWFIWFKNEQL